MANRRARPARPSARAFRALKRAGYVYKTTSRGATTIIGRTVKQRKTFMGLGYTTRVRVKNWIPPWKRR